MDVLGDSANKYVISKIELEETPPFDDKFDSFDFGSQNWIYLSGSYIIFKYGFVFLIIVYKVTNHICIKFKDYERARKIGSFVYNQNYGRLLQNIEKKLFMETYLDICVMCSLTYNSWLIK